MTNIVALDVAIGLTFVFVIYSLFATTIMEIFSTTFGLRARNLRYALRRMLQDEKSYGTGFWADRLAGLIGILRSIIKVHGFAIQMKNRALFHGFANEPSIKYLGSGGLSMKPSYISARDFSKALMDYMKKQGKDDVDVLNSIHNYLDSAGDSETATHIRSLLEDANNDLQKFRILLEQWYDNTMERAVGWYKKNIQFFLLAIGLWMAVTFNLDTIQTVKKLSKDPVAREQMVNMAIEFSNENEQRMKQLQDSAWLNDNLSAKLDSLKAIQEVLRNDMKDAQNVLGTNWNLPDSLRMTAIAPDSVGKDSSFYLHRFACKKQAYVVFPVTLDQNVLMNSLPKKIKENQAFVKLKANTYKWKYAWGNPWGYVLTALAISLGAPFWFDMLNKLVKLRSSVAQSTSSSKGGGSSKGSGDQEILNRVG